MYGTLYIYEHINSNPNGIRTLCSTSHNFRIYYNGERVSMARGITVCAISFLIPCPSLQQLSESTVFHIGERSLVRKLSVEVAAENTEVGA